MPRALPNAEDTMMKSWSDPKRRDGQAVLSEEETETIMVQLKCCERASSVGRVP